MHDLHHDVASAATPRNAFTRPGDIARWWALGAWLRLSIAGALAAPAGIAMLANPAERSLPAIAMIFGGVALAVFAGRRVARVMAKFDSSDAAVPEGRKSPASTADARPRTAAQGQPA